MKFLALKIPGQTHLEIFSLAKSYMKSYEYFYSSGLLFYEAVILNEEMEDKRRMEQTVQGFYCIYYITYILLNFA